MKINLIEASRDFLPSELSEEVVRLTPRERTLLKVKLEDCLDSWLSDYMETVVRDFMEGGSEN